MAAGYSAASDLANKLKVQQARAKQMGAAPGQPGAPVDPVPGDIASARAIQGMAPPTFAPGSSPLPQPSTRWTFAGPTGGNNPPTAASAPAAPTLPSQGGPYNPHGTYAGWKNPGQGDPLDPRLNDIGSWTAKMGGAPPAPSAATAPPGATVYGGDAMGPPAPPGGIDKTRLEQIRVAQLKLHYDRQGLQFGGNGAQSAYGGPEGVNAALGDNWRGLRDFGKEKMLLDDANRPVQQPQSSEDIRRNREELHYQLLGIADQRRQMAAKEQDPQKRAALVADVQRMTDAANRDLPMYNGPEDPRAVAIHDRQAAAVPGQRASRDTSYEAAQQQGGINQASERFRVEAAKSHARTMQEQMGTMEATARGERLGAEATANPEYAAQLSKAKLDEIRSRSLVSAAQLKETEAKMAGGSLQASAANPVYQKAIGDLGKVIGELGSGVGYAGGDAGGKVASLVSNTQALKDHILSQPPEVQAVLKREALASLLGQGLTDPNTSVLADIGRGASWLVTGHQYNERVRVNTARAHQATKDLLAFLQG